MKLQKKPLIPYLIISLFLAFLTHRAYVLYSIAPKPDMSNLFSQYTYVLEKYVEQPYFYPNFSPIAILAAMVGFFIGMMFYLKIKPDETLRMVKKQVQQSLRLLKRLLALKIQSQQTI